MCHPHQDGHHPDSKCGGGCKVLQMHCLGLLPDRCHSGGGHTVDREVPVAPGGDEGVKPDGQAQVFMFYEQLTDKEKQQLDYDFNSIQDIFFKQDFFEDCKEAAAQNAKCQFLVPTVMDWDRKMAPKILPGANVTYVEKVPEHKVAAWRSLGLDMYAKGYIGLVIMCGGLDSRLGQGMPKGILDFGLLSGKSILQLYAERVRRLQMLVSRRMEGEPTVKIPLYIMCNNENHDMLESYFQENNFFGLHSHDVTFFKQKNSPLFDHLGRFALADRHKIRQEPCGNGYLFQALASDGFMQDVKSRSATHLFVISIDNVLGKIGDPTFIGYCKQLGAEAGQKCTRKRSANEALGVLTTRKEEYYEDLDGDGSPDIVTKLRGINVEFYEMPENVKTKRLHAGTTDLAYDSGNLSQYVFKVSFMKRVFKHLQNKWHLVPKSKTRMNLVTGEIMKPVPGVRNLFRPEQFIFDSFEFTKGIAGFQVPREEYAVIKNMNGLDSPTSALAAIGKLHQSWIMNAGGEFVGSKIATDREDSKCEVSPLVSYDGEDLKGQFWMPIELPFYLPSQSELQSTSAVELDLGKEDSLHFVDKDTPAAKMQVEAELKFQIESMFVGKGKDSDEEHAFDEADSDEELPPTPHRKAEKKEEVKVVEVVQRVKRGYQDDPDKHALEFSADEIDATDWTEFMLSTRIKGNAHHALSSRTAKRREMLRQKEREKRKAKRKKGDDDDDDSESGSGSSREMERRRLAKVNMQHMPGSARQATAKQAGQVTMTSKGGKTFTDRAMLLGEHWDGEAPSLRCLPKNNHGLEKSEYGRRKPVTDHSLNSYWAPNEEETSRKIGSRNSTVALADATPAARPSQRGSGIECTIS